MNCNEARRLLAAHLDGELDVVRDAEVVAHLDACPACADAALAHAARRGLIREKLPRFAAPPGLDAAIRAALPAVPSRDRAAPRLWRQLLPLAAAVAVALPGGYQWGAARARARAEVDAVISAHVRAMMTGHAMDVVSTDQHTVKPWFAGKLDFSPPVRDLAADGFPLVGGRLDRVGRQPVAVLVYQRRKHEIDLFVGPAEWEGVTGALTQAGFNVVAWTRGDHRCVAVSDLASGELVDFSLKLQRAD